MGWPTSPGHKEPQLDGPQERLPRASRQKTQAAPRGQATFPEDSGEQGRKNSPSFGSRRMWTASTRDKGTEPGNLQPQRIRKQIPSPGQRPQPLALCQSFPQERGTASHPFPVSAPRRAAIFAAIL